MNALSKIDARRQSIAAATPSERKSTLGQFMTPSAVASFMTGMFDDLAGKDIRLLDAGAGIGSLTASFVERASKQEPHSLQCVAWEVDHQLIEHLAETFEACAQTFSGSKTVFSSAIKEEDFILAVADSIKFGAAPSFTHSILNPPYKKLATESDHRRKLSRVGIETSNVYAAFVSLALLMLEDGGELVAITPRSFCNGTYFKPFRRLLLENAALRQVHVFGARDHAFKGDSVLQENIIFHIVKGASQQDVVLSSSSDATFTDMTTKNVGFNEVVLNGDREQIIHLPVDEEADDLNPLLHRFHYSLSDLGISVSTGPVVDFRLRDHLRPDLEPGSVPLIFCLHFQDGFVIHPRPNKKANAIVENDETSRWLMPAGHYVLVRRLSSKEEKRRIVPAIFDPDRVCGERVGFDNHMNVFHEGKQGLSPSLARGLAIYLGSTFADKWFRRFNGHTQVNAGDLRALRYPDRKTLEGWGDKVGAKLPTQEEIDSILEEETR